MEVTYIIESDRTKTAKDLEGLVKLANYILADFYVEEFEGIVETEKEALDVLHRFKFKVYNNKGDLLT